MYLFPLPYRKTRDLTLSMQTSKLYWERNIETGYNHNLRQYNLFMSKVTLNLLFHDVEWCVVVSCMFNQDAILKIDY